VAPRIAPGKATAIGLASLGARVGITDRDPPAPRWPRCKMPWRATSNGEVRYALFRWRDLLVWKCWPGQGAARTLCTARVA